MANNDSGSNVLNVPQKRIKDAYDKINEMDIPQEAKNQMLDAQVDKEYQRYMDQRGGAKPKPDSKPDDKPKTSTVRRAMNKAMEMNPFSAGARAGRAAGKKAAGTAKKAKGGYVRKADGIAKHGKTRGRFV